jgi:lipopolysaccharide transport system ATP-binding protein
MDQHEVIRFDHVSKHYALAWHHAGGLKNLILNPRDSLGRMRRIKGDVLHDLSFSVRAGEAVGVIGPNGAGKSTLLGLVAGVIRPNRGIIEVRGRVAPLLELGAGFHPELSGRDNVILNAVLLGLPRRDALARIDEIVAFAEMEDDIDAPVRVYSSGMLARLGFAVAAHLSPDILLVDETLAVGDAAFQAKCIDKLAEFHRQGVTIICVSHDLEQIARIAQRVAVLMDHRFIYDGAPDEAFARYGAAFPAAILPGATAKGPARARSIEAVVERR